MSAISPRTRTRALVLAWGAALALGGAFSVLGAPTAQAQMYAGRAPWCADNGYVGVGFECAYYSFEQCMARASGISNVCSQNPNYVRERPPGRVPVKPQRRRAHRQ
jgi:hypothetical protein